MILTDPEPQKVAELDVVVRVACHSVYGIERKSGETVWFFDGANRWPSVAQDEERVFVAQNKHLVCLDRREGKVLFENKYLYPSALLQDEGILFMGCKDGTVSARDAASFESIWSQKFTSNISDLAKSGKTLFTSSGFDDIFAYDSETGEIKMTCSVDRNSSGLLLTGGENTEGSVYTVDPFKGIVSKIDGIGQLVWKHTYNFNNPVVPFVMKAYNNALFVAGVPKTLYALDTQTGGEMWRTTIVSGYSGTPYQIDMVGDRLEVTLIGPNYGEYKVKTFDPQSGEQL